MLANKYHDLLALGEQWLKLKIQRMNNLLKIAHPDDALYRELMLSLGYPNNHIPFFELALMTPFKELKELEQLNKIESALLYRAGFIEKPISLYDGFDYSLRMDRSVWNLRGYRPANHPIKRIKGISTFISEVIHVGMVNFFIEKITANMNVITNAIEAKKVVEKIMTFKGIGLERKREMFFNIILPFLISYTTAERNNISKFLYNVFELHPPLSQNKYIKSFRSSLPPECNFNEINYSTKTYFGIILFEKNKKMQ